MAWLAAPLFGPVTAVTTMFLPSELSVVMQISTIPSGSVTFLIGGSMLNSGSVCMHMRNYQGIYLVYTSGTSDSDSHFIITATYSSSHKSIELHLSKAAGTHLGITLKFLRLQDSVLPTHINYCAHPYNTIHFMHVTEHARLN